MAPRKASTKAKPKRKATQNHGNPAAFKSFRNIREQNTTITVDQEDGSQIAITNTQREEILVTVEEAPKKRKRIVAKEESPETDGNETDGDKTGDFEAPKPKRKKESTPILNLGSTRATRSQTKATGEVCATIYRMISAN